MTTCEVCGKSECSRTWHEVVGDVEERDAVDDAVARARAAEAEAWKRSAEREAHAGDRDAWRVYAAAAIRGMTSRPYTVSRETGEHAAAVADAMVEQERKRFGS